MVKQEMELLKQEMELFRPLSEIAIFQYMILGFGILSKAHFWAEIL